MIQTLASKLHWDMGDIDIFGRENQVDRLRRHAVSSGENSPVTFAPTRLSAMNGVGKHIAANFKSSVLLQRRTVPKGPQGFFARYVGHIRTAKTAIRSVW